MEPETLEEDKIVTNLTLRQLKLVVCCFEASTDEQTVFYNQVVELYSKCLNEN